MQTRQTRLAFSMLGAGCLLCSMGCSDAPPAAREKRVDFGPPPAVEGAVAEEAKQFVPAQHSADMEKSIGVNEKRPDPQAAPPLAIVTPQGKKTPEVKPSAQANQPAPTPTEHRATAEEGLRARRGRREAWDYIGNLAVARQSVSDRLNLGMYRHNLDLYKADHDNKAPKTNEEMMRIIKDEWLLKLPDPPPGSKYVYDPSDEQLYLDDE